MLHRYLFRLTLNYFQREKLNHLTRKESDILSHNVNIISEYYINTLHFEKVTNY